MLLTIILVIFLGFSLVMLFVITSAFLGFLITRVPFVPTYASDIKFIVHKLNISSRETFYDLGSGDGKVVFLVEQLSGAHAVGFELTWWTHLLARLKKRFKGSQAEFRNQNFFKHDWSGADYIYGYLYPPLMGRIEEKFLSDCRPGSVAIIRDFPLPHLKPAQVYHMPRKHELYIYRKA